ncbi:lysophospholipid acyltransferase family protein [Saccharopolyspora cebuensis]|uniref:Lysophospholipid acyltransferase family protein n=1 Tax=Saccharopolyspora cebuensis TaxID=418759 RepID=A0ABV4CPF2_9PSEU
MTAVTVDHACRLDCVPDHDRPPEVGPPRRAARRLAFAASCALAYVLGLVAAALRPPAARRLLGLWCRSALRAAGIRVRIDGVGEHSGPTLVVANHVSFFDGLAMLAAHPHLVGVGTHQSRSNPVLGRLFTRSGVIFVDGTDRAAIPGMVRDVAAELAAGDSVLVYPEGAPRCREPGGPFRPAVFQAALDAGVPVQPVLTRCVLRDGTPTARASWYTGEEEVGSMLDRVFRMRGLELRITLLPPVELTDARDRRELARTAWDRLVDRTGPLPSDCVTADERARC